MLVSSSATKRATGDLAEQIAEKYLIEKGLTLIERNYLCKIGEIDLVMRDGKQWVFVEVRYRKNAGFGSALETVTRKKQKKIISAAEHYILKKIGPIADCRFDVLGITGEKISWVPSAFPGNEL